MCSSDLDVFLLDEAQRLRPGERDRLLAAAQPARDGLQLILSSHKDLTSLFVQKGLSLATFHIEHFSNEIHLDAVLSRRLSYFALDKTMPGVTFAPEAVSYLHETFGGNLRALQNFLYEVFQRLKAKGAITADYLQAEAEVIGGAGPK